MCDCIYCILHMLLREFDWDLFCIVLFMETLRSKTPGVPCLWGSVTSCYPNLAVSLCPLLFASRGLSIVSLEVPCLLTVERSVLVYKRVKKGAYEAKWSGVSGSLVTQRSVRSVLSVRVGLEIEMSN